MKNNFDDFRKQPIRNVLVADALCHASTFRAKSQHKTLHINTEYVLKITRELFYLNSCTGPQRLAISNHVTDTYKKEDRNWTRSRPVPLRLVFVVLGV